MPLTNISNIVLVLSGKGGVGKSSVTLQLALSLSSQGHNVGILDIDLTGPSIPRLLGLEDAKITQAPGGWLPVEVHPALTSTTSHTSVQNGVEPHSQPPTTTTTSTPSRGSLHALSLAFLLPSRSSAVIWRGPKKTAMIRQFVSDVLWPPNTDFLLIDTPPGTSDEHIAIVEELHKLATTTTIQPVPSNGTATSPAQHPQPPHLAGAVVVTTPQAISTADVRKELNFCTKTSVPVIGVIENMSGYMCPCCGEVTNLFSKGGGEVMAREMGVRFLGGVPVDQGWGEVVERDAGVEGREGKDQDEDEQETGRQRALLIERYAACGLSKIFEGFARDIDEHVKSGR